MNRSGRKHLIIASVLEILLGIGSIVGIQALLGAQTNGTALSEAMAKSALFGVFYLYGANGFKIVAGLLGILLSNKKSLVTIILGALLFVAQLVAFIGVEREIVQIVIHIVLLAIPYYYLHNAVKNYRS